MTKSCSNQALVRLKLVGFNKSDKAKFTSILTIAESRLDVPWQVVDSTNADFYLLNHRLRALINQDATLQSLPRKQCIFYTHNIIDRNDNELIISQATIPSLGSLVLLFNHLTSTKPVTHTSTSLSEQPKSTVVDHHPAASAEDSLINNTTINLEPETEYFDPEQGFVGLLISNKKGIKYFNLNNATGFDKLYIHPDEKSYYSNNKLESLNNFFSSSKSLSPQFLSEVELQQQIAAAGLKPQPLNNLIWYSTFSCSQGNVIKGHNPNDIVRLKRWPPINLPGCRKLIKLAAYMQSNAVDLNVAQTKTGIPMNQIYNFYNACKVTDLIEHVQQTDTYEKNLGDEKRQMFAKIGKRLNQSRQS